MNDKEIMPLMAGIIGVFATANGVEHTRKLLKEIVEDDVIWQMFLVNIERAPKWLHPKNTD